MAKTEFSALVWYALRLAVSFFLRKIIWHSTEYICEHIYKYTHICICYIHTHAEIYIHLSIDKHACQQRGEMYPHLDH